MAAQLSQPLKQLLLAMNLGRSTAHPLAGWHMLEILYRDGATAGEPITMSFLVRRYNADHLEEGESAIADQGLRAIMTILVRQAQLVEEVPRKVRERMKSGRFHIVQSSVFRIASSGIEYLKAMQRVIDAENTVVASTQRIGEYCAAVASFAKKADWQTDTMDLFNRFQAMLSAYDDVMNGLRKLDVDLHDITTDLAFDHGGMAADHLQAMLHDQAIPAYKQMLNQSQRIQWLLGQTDFAEAVAFSRQSADNLDVSIAIGDASKLATQRRDTQTFVNRRLAVMAQSFDPSTSAISLSFDSIYLLFQTLWEAVQMLSREFDHVQRQSVDIKALTADIDELMTHYQQLTMPAGLPKHLPMDRLGATELATLDDVPAGERATAMAELTSTVRADMLEAGSMEPVNRTISEANRVQYTLADNPEVAEDGDLAEDDTAAMLEFEQLVMRGADTVVVDGPLTFTTSKARDAAVMLFAATQYEHPDIFAPFGRLVASANVIPDSDPVMIRLAGSDYGAELPAGYTVTLVPMGVENG